MTVDRKRDAEFIHKRLDGHHWDTCESLTGSQQVTRHHVMCFYQMTHSFYSHEPEVMTHRFDTAVAECVTEQSDSIQVIQKLTPSETAHVAVTRSKWNEDVPSGLFAVVSKTRRDERAFGMFLKYVSHSPFFFGSYKNIDTKTNITMLVLANTCVKDTLNHLLLKCFKKWEIKKGVISYYIWFGKNQHSYHSE